MSELVESDGFLTGAINEALHGEIAKFSDDEDDASPTEEKRNNSDEWFCAAVYSSVHVRMLVAALRLNSVSNDTHFRPIKQPDKVEVVDISPYLDELYGVLKECVQDFQAEECVIQLQFAKADVIQ